MEKLNVAFIGLDHAHIHNLSHDFQRRDDVNIVGIAGVSPYTEEEKNLNIRINVPTDFDFKIWDDYKELLKQNIDIAVICTGIGRHADIVEETLRMGIHTVAEKPMALTRSIRGSRCSGYPRGSGGRHSEAS